MSKMEDSHLGMLHDDPYSDYNYYGLVYVLGKKKLEYNEKTNKQTRIQAIICRGNIFDRSAWLKITISP